MSIRAVVFDIGGVLEITPPTGWQKKWAGRLGIPASEITRRLVPVWQAGAIGQVTLEQAEGETARALVLAGREMRELMDDAWAEYLGTLNQDLCRYFCGLRPRYRTGILSISFVGARERERDKYQFEEMCDVIVYSHEEGIKKPDSRVYGRVCERLGVQPAEVLFLDDTDECVAGARAVGMTAVTYADNDQAMTAMDSCL